MHVGFNIAADLDAALSGVAAKAGLDPDTFAPGVRSADPKHGDYQANGVLAYAKQAGANPRALAAQLVAALPAELRDVCDVSVAGPGFINFTLKPAVLLGWLRAHPSRAALAEGAKRVRAGQTWVVDYSSPNTAKQMHVGHLRSAVIGEALCRLQAFCGAKVIRDNHIGDWGTQFGKLIWAYRRHLDAAALERDPLEEFERLYKLGQAASETDISVLEAARSELVKLQSGDAENLAVWKRINESSLLAFKQIYEQLGIRFDVTLGESFYNDGVDAVYRELAGADLATESDGALVVFHPEHPRFKTQPLIVRKSDGAANYASTDLATILYRAEHFHATDVLYVVDKRQSDHFAQLFLTAQKWFERTGRVLPRLEHVDFGFVLGEDGHPLKTRSGDNIKLKELLAEAAERAYALVTEKSPDIAEDERRSIAAVVGVGSVQYADLSQNRSSDYVFSWAKMISLEGNTAAYLLYAIARIHSIFRRHGLAPGAPEAEAGATPPETPEEKALARRVAKVADTLRLASDTLRPHFICLYLYELTGDFSTFYNADKVLVDDPPVRARRLLLCARTLLTLETGLEILGLKTLTRM
jgi:arginyl-tRNA synthetase